MLIIESENAVLVHLEEGDGGDDKNVKAVIEEQVPDTSSELEREAQEEGKIPLGRINACGNIERGLNENTLGSWTVMQVLLTNFA